MPIKLKDIPVGRLTPEEVEALSNETFNYADRERVSMREAERKIIEEKHNDIILKQLIRAGDFQEGKKIPGYVPLRHFEKGTPGDEDFFTFKEKTFEFGKAIHRGLGAIVKFPGVALKAIGEQALTRAEIAELKESPHAIQRLRAKGMESPAGKGARAFANMLRKAGNKYIEVVNGMMLDESPESRSLRAQAFMNAPLYRTSMATGESVPIYGLAIAATLTSGNPNLGLFVLGTTTATSSYENLRQQGVDPDLALIGATLEGTIEMVTEKIPMDMLMKGAARPLLIRALSLGTAESFQELFAQLGQNYVSAVVKDVDPEDYSTVLQAAQQEWSIIHQGWEDAMAAGFLMGTGAGVFVSGGLPEADFGLRTAEEIRADYGFVPRNVNELISLTDQIKQRVKDVEKKAEVPPTEAIAAPEKPVAEQTPAEVSGIAPTGIQALSDKQLAEKLLSAPPTSPEWVAAFKEQKRRKAEKPPAAPTAEGEGVVKLIEQGYTKEQAEFIQQNRVDMIDRKSPTIQEVLDNPQDYPVLGETGKIAVFRVSEKGGKLTVGKYVFDSKEKAEAFREEFGFIRGQPNIIEKVVDKSDLRKTQDAGEYIFFPVKAQPRPAPTEVAKPEAAGVAPTEPLLSELVTDVKEAMNEFIETRPLISREHKARRETAEKALKEARKRLGKELAPKGTPTWKMTKRQFEAKAIADRSVVANLNAMMAGLAEEEGFEHVPYIPEEIATTHKREVEKALKEGKPVPAEVLAEYPELKPPTEPAKEIGEGEEKPRGTSVSVMAQAIENEIVEENKSLYDEIPTYRAMNMKEQAEKALALIEGDLEKAKRIAFYQEPAPPDLFPENIFSALRTYAKMNLDIDLIMDLALKEDVVREHTIMGKRIKSLDTDQDYGDPVRAIREVVESRMEQKVRRGEDISALEVKLRELQTELDKVTKAQTEFTKRAERTYGKRNKLVSRTEYDSIIARRKKEAVGFAGRAGGVAYVPNAQDFADIAKIATFHLEAMGRDFAKWSYQMTRDFGDWITPHLQDEYDKAIAEAKKAGVEIKKSKRLITKKKRLATTTGKIEAKLEELDLAKVPRIPIELDEEGQRLQTAYDLAREKYKAAQAVANIITEKEVRIIAQLSKDAAERKAVMEKSERRKEGEGATQTELEYGTAISMFLEYVNDLKVEANKRTMKEVIKNYLSNPVDFISDFAGTLKAAKASLDNSFHLRQGLPTFLKAITGHIPSAKIWWKTFIKSWKMMWDTLRKRKVMRGLFAEMISDPDYDLLKKSKVALNVIEEEIPVDIPSRIPILGMLFRMGENAFVGSSRYMRYQLAKQYLNVWRKSGVELTQRELESLGRLANSQTGRGETAAKSKKPGLLNNVFWSPRNLRAYVDILTVHMFDRNFSPFARKQAAINLLRYVSGAAMILTLAKWIDDDSVTWDTKSSDFGKIKVGNTRFSVGGGMAILVILASRLINREFTSSTTGVTKSIDTGKFGAFGGKDLVFNFVENKLSPAAGLVLSIIDQKTWDGSKLTIPQMVNDALTPLIIQNVFETGSAEDSANVLAALMAETMGVNVQTYSDRKKQKTNKRTKL